MLVSAAAMGGQALAAGTVNQYGSVKLQWNVAVAMNAVIHTNYTAAFAYGGAAGTIGANGAAGGSCGVEANTGDLTMVWGTITPPSGGTYEGCDYQNAVGVSVQTNDSNGFAVYEYLDTALPAGTQLCAFPNGGATFPITTPGATVTTTAWGTAPAAYSAGCAAPGKLISQAGAIQNAGGGPAAAAAPNPATGEYASGAAGIGQAIINTASTTGVAEFGAEDLQLNVDNAAASGNNISDIMTLQFVAN
jgi:hypothetical protein